MPKDTITEADEQLIQQAIREAERNTSGEIRVHIENHCEGEVLDRATTVFAQLHMHLTKLRNGVLFYVAIKDHQFAVLGDAGINAIVPDRYWEDITEVVISHFKKREYAAGLSKGIVMAGEQLKTHFPYENKGDINELSDDVSFGD
ncbi:membrane protein [Pontibacter sp. HJ8]